MLGLRLREGEVIGESGEEPRHTCGTQLPKPPGRNVNEPVRTTHEFGDRARRERGTDRWSSVRARRGPPHVLTVPQNGLHRAVTRGVRPNARLGRALAVTRHRRAAGARPSAKSRHRGIRGRLRWRRRPHARTSNGPTFETATEPPSRANVHQPERLVANPGPCLETCVFDRPVPERPHGVLSLLPCEDDDVAVPNPVHDELLVGQGVLSAAAYASPSPWPERAHRGDLD